MSHRKTSAFIEHKLIKLASLEHSMEIQLEADTSNKINKISKKLGLKKSDLIQKIILAYIQTLEKQNSLKKELKDWDTLSDEALMNFEESL